MSKPERLRYFALRLILILIPSYLLWALAEPYVLKGMWIISDAVWPRMFFSSPNARVDIIDNGWRIHTFWPIARIGDQPEGFASPTLTFNSIKHILSGFPLLLALMLATNGRTWKKTAVALLCQVGITWLAISGSLWHTLVVLTGTHREFFTAVPPSAYKLSIEPAPVWQFYASGYLMYLSLLIIPFVAPVVLWLCLMHRELRFMVLRLQHRHRHRPS